MAANSADARPLRVIHLCYSDGGGGAAIGARRSHQAMLSQGLESRLVVVSKTTDDDRVVELPQRPYRRYAARRLAQTISAFQRSNNPVIRTFNIVPMGAAAILNAMDGDIIQMHWIAADTISIGEMTQLNKPVVWKLPDMWGFSGAEHYLNPGDPERFVEGYTRDNRPDHQSGIDLDRWVWAYKHRKWQDAQLNIVGPSRWISDCAKRSKLFGAFPIRNIPNPLDLSLYQPRDQRTARDKFGLSHHKRLIMFGAMQATSDRRKGFGHLQSALEHLGKHLDPSETELVVVGADGPDGHKINEFNVRYLGIIRDEGTLVESYNAADVFVLPCEMDNLPNVIKEATCCGVPCAGFNVGGMPDMVDHLETGYLATPYDAEELAHGIGWVAQNNNPEARREVRRRAETKHDQAVAVARYMDFYYEILDRKAEGFDVSHPTVFQPEHP